MLWISVDKWPLHGGGLVESTNVRDGPPIVAGKVAFIWRCFSAKMGGLVMSLRICDLCIEVLWCSGMYITLF